MKQKKIFLSYSYHNKDIADKIRKELTQSGLDVFTDYGKISPGQEIFEQLNYLFESSDTLVILFSKDLFESKYFRFEYPREFFEVTEKRKINVIPVLIEKCTIPKDFLAYQIVNLTNNYEKNIEKLIDKLKASTEISFEHLNPHKFENLVYDLLKEFRFFNIEVQTKHADTGIDFIAEHFYNSPFGIKHKETWIIETKFYRESRVDLHTIRKLIESYKYIGKDNAKILLITTSILTSVVQEYINEAQEKYGIDFDVVDGLALKNIISRRTRLIKKYFQS
jgi:hypothetical protein